MLGKNVWRDRQTNENTNGLLRQYLLKKTDFSLLTHEPLKAHVRQLNQRPRKCLDCRTPVEMFWERNVALTIVSSAPRTPETGDCPEYLDYWVNSS